MLAERNEVFHQIRVSDVIGTVNDVFTNSSRVEIGQHTYFVPSLESLCVNLLASNFVNIKEIDLLSESEPILYESIINKLLVNNNSSLPLQTAIPRISSETYWKECCHLSWSQGFLHSRIEEEKEFAQNNGREFSWKQFYLECLLCDFIKAVNEDSKMVNMCDNREEDNFESLANRNNAQSANLFAKSNRLLSRSYTNECWFMSACNAEKVKELCVLVKDYIHSVNLTGLNVHVALYDELLIYLPNVSRLIISYASHTTGLSYSDVNTHFTNKDAECVRYVLEHCPKLKYLELSDNGLTSPHVLAISAGMLSNCTLQVLNLSHNNLKDEAIVKGISIVLKNPSCALRSLILADNMIGSEGACALADALIVNKLLKRLDLSQNVIPDVNGGDVLVNSLVLNTTIEEFNMSNNKLGRSTVEALRLVLPQTSSLKVLNVSGNVLIGKDEIDVLTLASSDIENEGETTPNNSLKCNVHNKYNTADPLHQTNSERLKINLIKENKSSDGYLANVDNLHDKTESVNSNVRNAESLANVAYESIPHSDNGAALCEAVLQNDSLIKVDVRNCLLTDEEVKLINNTICERVRNFKLMQKNLINVTV